MGGISPPGQKLKVSFIFFPKELENNVLKLSHLMYVVIQKVPFISLEIFLKETSLDSLKLFQSVLEE